MTSSTISQRKYSKSPKGTADAESEAAAAAAYPFQYCSVLTPQPLVLPPEVVANPGRMRAIIGNSNKWVNHTVLHYAFFRTGPWAVPDAQAAIVRKAFGLWKQVPIGVDFAEVHDLGEAEIRIGYLIGDGSWSYIARDILNIPVTDRTMSFGWPLNQDDYGLTTAVHEIGHTLGMPHEHQNPFAGIVWDEEKVYASLGAPPNNWDRDTVYNNVLRKLDAAEYTGSKWDPDSIMEYAFPKGLIKQPSSYRTGINPPGTISPVDSKWIETWYPGTSSADGKPDEPELKLNQSVTVEVGSGQQVDYTVRVEQNREYTIGTFGATDALLTLFEDVDGQPRFVAGDDDSAKQRSAAITYRLRPGRTYHVRLRLIYKGKQGTVTMMYW
jgi:Astacin (Peptidase family M12A)